MVALLTILVMGTTVALVAPRIAAADPIGAVTTYVATVSMPQSIVTGPDGNLWFTNGGSTYNSHGGDTIGRISPSGALTAFTDPSVLDPDAITTGPDGNLWFINHGMPPVGTPGGPGNGLSIGTITAAGVITHHTGGSMTHLGGIATGTDGNLWFTNRAVYSSFFGFVGTTAIERMAPDGTVTMFTGGLGTVGAITAGPDGNLWFTNGDAIGRITTAGVITTFTDATISGPSGITAGPDGNLWFTNTTGNSIGRITPTGTVSNVATPDIIGPTGITRGPDGNLWYASTTDNSIGRITPGGSTTRFTGPGISGATGIAAGPDGNVWFTNGGNDSIGRISPAGASTSFAGNGINEPQNLVEGPDGNLWFANTGNHTLGRISPGGATAHFPYGGTGGVTGPGNLTVGPDGNLWYTVGIDIGRMTPAGVVTVFTVAGLAIVSGFAIGADGNLWFTDVSTNVIGRITPTGTATLFHDPGLKVPSGLVRGADGNLWFTNGQSGAYKPTSIGRITPAGTITVFSGIADPQGLVDGRDGNLWFFNTAGNAIGRITPAGVVTTFKKSAMSVPSGIVVAPSGTLWFLDAVSNVYRITTAGVITAFTPPAGVTPQLLTVGADGNLWFAGQNLLGRIAMDGTFTTIPTPELGSATKYLHPGPDGNLWFGTSNAVTKIGTGIVAGIGGTVTDAARAPLPGIVVTLMANWPSWTTVATTTTGADGTYRVDLPAGTYRVRYIDPTGRHARTWWPNTPSYKTASPITVAGLPVAADQTLAPNPGALRGRATHGPVGNATQPVVGIMVRVFDQASTSFVAAATTGTDGYYQLNGLAPGTYLIQFIDPTHTYRAIWFGQTITAGRSTTVAVTSSGVAWASSWLGT